MFLMEASKRICLMQLPKVYTVRLSFIKLNYSTTANLTEGEKKLVNLLREKLNVADIHVQDISGGCGSMYEIFVSSIDFKGKNTVQQHRLVNKILKEEVKVLHGFRLKTAIPKD